MGKPPMRRGKLVMVRPGTWAHPSGWLMVTTFDHNYRWELAYWDGQQVVIDDWACRTTLHHCVEDLERELANGRRQPCEPLPEAEGLFPEDDHGDR